MPPVPLSPDGLHQFIHDRLPDNARNQITPADLRAVCLALAAAATPPPAPSRASARAAQHLVLFERCV